MLLLLIIFNIIFILYFYYINLWYLGLIPIFFLLFVMYLSNDKESGMSVNTSIIKDFLLSAKLVFAWIAVIMGVRGMLTTQNLIQVDGLYILLFMGILNFIFVYLSSIFKFRDGIKVFHVGYYFCFVMTGVLAYLWGKLAVSEIIVYLIYINALTLGLYSFYNFIIITLFPFENKDFQYYNFLFLIFSLLGLLYWHFSSDMTFLAFSAQVLLCLILFFIFLVKRIASKEVEESYVIKDPVEDILAGKKITQKSKIYNNLSLIGLNNFFESLNMVVKASFALLNVFFVFLQIFLFFWDIKNGTTVIYHEILYWCSILIFFANYILVKFLGYFYQLQRIFVFFFINFAIYLTIIDLFGNNTFYIVILGVAWNLVNSILIFASKSLNFTKVLYREDFLLWLLANLTAMIVNLYFVYRLEGYSNRQKFYFVLLYVGIQLIIKYYNIQYISKLKYSGKEVEIHV